MQGSSGRGERNWLAVPAMVALAALVVVSLFVLTKPFRGPRSPRALRTWEHASGHLVAIRFALDAYHADFGDYPPERRFRKLIWGGESGHGPYLDSTVPTTDPWGREWIYENDGVHTPTLRCYCADGQPGGDWANQDHVIELKPLDDE